MILLKRFFDFFVYGNFLIAFAALSLVIQSEIIFFNSFNINHYHLQVFFATLFIYNLHRLIGIENSSSNSLRVLWAKNNLLTLKILMLFSILGLIIATLFGNIIQILLLAPFLLVTLAYSLPIFSKGEKKIRIREINYLKPFIISFVWAFVTVVIPAIYGNEFPSKSIIIMVFIERLFFVLAITIPFDIRDIEDDQNKGIITLPTKIGEKKSKLYALITLMCFFLTLIVQQSYWTGISENVFLSYFISGVITAALISLTKKNHSDYFFLFWLDGTLILQSFLVFILS